jgi:AAA+ superfamily predicted ATPase
MLADQPVAEPALQDPLTLALRVLDQLLTQAIEASAGQREWPDPSTPADPVALLAAPLANVERFATLANVLGLQAIDQALLLIALAPDLDPRCERLCAKLQDDAACRRPSMALCDSLLARNAVERMALRARFSRKAPLVQQRVLVTQAGQLRVDAIWRAWLLQADIEDALPAHCRLDDTASVPDFAADAQTLHLLEQVCLSATRTPPRLWLQGEHGAGKLAMARAVAQRLGVHLVVMDLREAGTPADIGVAIDDAARVALLFGAALCVHGLQRLEQRDPQLLRALLVALAAAPCAVAVLCVAGPAPLHAAATPWVRVAVQFPSAALRLPLWQRAMVGSPVPVAPQALDTLAARFSLSAAQIAQAACEAQALAALRGQAEMGYSDIAASVRQQCGSELAQMATRITPRARLDALVSATEVQAQLREICARVGTRHCVGQAWAAESVHARQTGVTALFVGASGTGKTLAAESVAHELGLDLYRIDLAGIVSKYIGQTEKNLDRVFAAAEHANAVLFFDEADALFGKRSEVKDAHDRYANIEVAYLLQKMEQFNGLAILATNLKQNLDDAFARRLTFTVNFPFPEEAERRRLWEQMWPAHAPCGDDIDLGWFAREFRLSGGNIRNTVVAAVHLAAASGQAISREHLLHATRREYQKLGKNLVHAPATGRPDA